jgi:hypothetical protein
METQPGPLSRLIIDRPDASPVRVSIRWAA